MVLAISSQSQQMNWNPFWKLFHSFAVLPFIHILKKSKRYLALDGIPLARFEKIRIRNAELVQPVQRH